jgi:cytochrome c
MRTGIALALVGALTVVAGAARADGDAAAGKAVFNKCAACHSPAQGVNKIGPSLFGVVGRHSASIADFSYSPAMKATNWDWTPEQLNKYLVDPRGVVPGTKMIFPGLKSDADRANVIAYLATLK